MLRAVFCCIFANFLLTSCYSFTFSSNETFFGNDFCETIIEDDLVRSGGYRLWPEGKIVYDLESSLRPQDHEIFQTAIDDFHRHTCLSFRPRSPEDTAYMQIRIVEYTRCGRATICYTGIPQKVEIDFRCSWPQTFVHEIGHGLCLRHEHQRVDRDDFLDYSSCTEPESIYAIDNNELNQRDIYDYYSSMHYSCGGCYGVPKQADVRECSNNHGLGIIDADKLNAVYNCQGCHRHRWFRVDTLTQEEEASLVNFASAEGDQEPVYLCRGYLKGQISTGKYLIAEKACLLFHWGGSDRIFKHIQLFALPNGPNIVTNTTSGYRLFSCSEGEQARSRAVRVGRSDWDDTFFAGLTVYEEEGKAVTVLGRLEYMYQLEFPTLNGKSYTQDVNKFSILGCFE